MDRSMTHQYKTDKQCFIVERATLKRGPWLDESIPQPGHPTKSAGSYPHQQRKSEYRVQSSYFYHTTRWGSLRLGILYKSSIHMQRYTARSWSEYSHSPEMYKILPCPWRRWSLRPSRVFQNILEAALSFLWILPDGRKQEEVGKAKESGCAVWQELEDPDDTGSWRDSTGILLVQDLRNRSPRNWHEGHSADFSGYSS